VHGLLVTLAAQPEHGRKAAGADDVDEVVLGNAGLVQDADEGMVGRRGRRQWFNGHCRMGLRRRAGDRKDRPAVDWQRDYCASRRKGSIWIGLPDYKEELSPNPRCVSICRRFRGDTLVSRMPSLRAARHRHPYKSLMPIEVITNGLLMSFSRIPLSSLNQRENAVTDLLYLAAGVAVFLLFAGYAALLRRA
jgi:hypothetical protein